MLAGQIVQGTGFGIFGDLVIGIIGAFIGNWLLPRLGIHLGTGIVSAIINATLGAIVLLLIMRMLRLQSGWHGSWGGSWRQLPATTHVDIKIANTVAAHTGPRMEKASEVLIWGADEHVLCALAAGWWMYSRNKDSNQKRASDHVLLCTLVSAALPHALKTLFDRGS